MNRIKRKNRTITLIFGIIAILFGILNYITFYAENPEKYQKPYNDERKELGLPIIPEDWITELSDKNSAHQQWIPLNETFPGYLAKYINCDTKRKRIRQEIDKFGIYNNGQKEIIEFHYYYDNDSIDWKCYRLTYKKENNSNLIKFPSYEGELIEEVSFKEADSLLRKNNINRLK